MSKDTAYPVRLAAVLISIALVVLGLYLLQDLLILLSFSMILAMLVLPVCSWLESKGIARSLAISLCILIMFAFIGLLLLLLVGQIAEFASDWPMFIRKAEKWVAGLQSFLSHNLNISRKKQMVEVSNQTINLLKNSGDIITTTFGTVIHGITTLIIVPIFVFFFLYYRQFFADFLAQVFPTTDRTVLHGIMQKTGSVVQSYLVGLLAVMLSVSLLCVAGFWWIGVDYFMFFGCLTGILLLMPYIGIWIGAADYPNLGKFGTQLCAGCHCMGGGRSICRSKFHYTAGDWIQGQHQSYGSDVSLISRGNDLGNSWVDFGFTVNSYSQSYI